MGFGGSIFGPLLSHGEKALSGCLSKDALDCGRRNAVPSGDLSDALAALTVLLDDLDITGWLEWFLMCLGRAFDRAETILAAVLSKARFWDRFAATELNERQRSMINRLLNGFEGKLTSSKWAKLETCSQDTALRDIEDLIRKGVLKKESAGGRSTSYSLARVG